MLHLSQLSPLHRILECHQKFYVLEKSYDLHRSYDYITCEKYVFMKFDQVEFINIMQHLSTLLENLVKSLLRILMVKFCIQKIFKPSKPLQITTLFIAQQQCVHLASRYLHDAELECQMLHRIISKVNIQIPTFCMCHILPLLDQRI